MGYFMRYFIMGGASGSPTLADLGGALGAIDPTFTLIPDLHLPGYGQLYHGETLLAEIEINVPDDDVLAEDLEDLRDLLAFSQHPNKDRVIAALDTLQSAVVVEAYWPGTESEAALDKTDLLFDWLFDHYPGLLQMDGQGFFDREAAILPMHLRL
jgi:hypothetical protein